MAQSAKKIGTDTRYVKITNQLIRISAVSNLTNQQVGIKVSVHNNVHFIQPYLQIDQGYRSKIVESIQNNDSGINAVFYI